MGGRAGWPALAGATETDIYQQKDAACIDYQMWEWRRARELPGGVLHLRGPAPDAGPYLSCLGSAHTFGRHCRAPFPTLLGQQLGLEVYNFGRGSFGPRAWLDNRALLETVNGSRCVVIQLPSARGQTNALYPHGARYSQRLRVAGGRTIGARRMLRQIVRRHPRARVEAIVAEMQAGFVRDMTRVLHSIRAPKVLFYFSKRAAADRFRGYHANGLLGGFPGLVDRAMTEAMRPHADAYVSCVSTTGVPQPLVDRRTGAVRGWNTYYPTPEMHAEAARALAPACRAVMQG